MNKKIFVFSFLMLLSGMMFLPVTTVFAEEDSSSSSQAVEVQWKVSIRVNLTGGYTSGTVTVWATSGSEAEERGKEKWKDQNPRQVSQIVSMSADATRL